MNLFKFRKDKIEEPRVPTIEEGGEGKSVVTLIREIVAGDVFLKEAVQKQLGLVALIFLLSMVYVNNKFLYEKELREVSSLRREVEDLRYRSLTLSKEMKQAGRKTMIIEALEERGIDLEEAREPIVVIKE